MQNINSMCNTLIADATYFQQIKHINSRGHINSRCNTFAVQIQKINSRCDTLRDGQQMYRRCNKDTRDATHIQQMEHMYNRWNTRTADAIMCATSETHFRQGP
jgi:hypothetical protein